MLAGQYNSGSNFTPSRMSLGVPKCSETSWHKILVKPNTCGTPWGTVRKKQCYSLVMEASCPLMFYWQAEHHTLKLSNVGQGRRQVWWLGLQHAIRLTHSFNDLSIHKQVHPEEVGINLQCEINSGITSLLISHSDNGAKISTALSLGEVKNTFVFVHITKCVA